MSKTVRTTENILDSLYQNLHGEKLHTKYCKYVLGVHSKSSNLACVGELVCNDILKYYFYASQKTDDSLIGQTLQTGKHLHEKGAKSWYTGVNTILTKLNLNETNCNQAKFSLKNTYKNVWLTKWKGKFKDVLQFQANYSKGSLS